MAKDVSLANSTTNSASFIWNALTLQILGRKTFRRQDDLLCSKSVKLMRYSLTFCFDLTLILTSNRSYIDYYFLPILYWFFLPSDRKIFRRQDDLLCPKSVKLMRYSITFCFDLTLILTSSRSYIDSYSLTVLHWFLIPSDLTLILTFFRSDIDSCFLPIWHWLLLPSDLTLIFSSFRSYIDPYLIPIIWPSMKPSLICSFAANYHLNHRYSNQIKLGETAEQLLALSEVTYLKLKW